MSFFPSADPNEEQTPYLGGQPWSRQNTTPITQQTRNDCFDFGFNDSTTTQGLPNSQTTAWTSSFEQPHGLGLHYAPASFAPGYSGSVTFSQPASTSFTWPADFTPTQTPFVSPGQLRRDSCGDNCDPPATVQPSQLWDLFQHTAALSTVRDPSAERSEYSTSSFQSAASSPIVRSDCYGIAAGRSPLVKIESEQAVSDSSLFHGIPALQEPSPVRSRDFAVPQAAASDRYVSPGFQSTLSDGADLKPSLQPDYRRAHSAADTEEIRYQGRRKRSLTGPENASCSCEVCGKFFQRCYNLRAHMETHDANRSMPNKCKYPGCGKRFVRRTDLMRHNESVGQTAPRCTCKTC